MPRLRVEEPGERIIEVWEITTPGTVYVATYDKRDERYVQSSVSGTNGARRLRISRDDREYNQERIPEENVHLDPFLNGQLRRVDTGPEDSRLGRNSTLSNDDLKEILSLTDHDLFESTVKDVAGELMLRRLLSIAEDQATRWQYDVVNELVRERYPVGGQQRTARELFEEERLTQLGIGR